MGLGQRLTGPVGLAICGGQGLAGQLIALAGGAFDSAGLGEGRIGCLEARGGLGQLTGQNRLAIALAQAHRRGRRRACGHGESVPAPERALAADQTLALGELAR